MRRLKNNYTVCPEVEVYLIHRRKRETLTYFQAPYRQHIALQALWIEKTVTLDIMIVRYISRSHPPTANRVFPWNDKPSQPCCCIFFAQDFCQNGCLLSRLELKVFGIMLNGNITFWLYSPMYVTNDETLKRHNSHDSCNVSNRIVKANCENFVVSSTNISC